MGSETHTGHVGSEESAAFRASSKIHWATGSKIVGAACTFSASVILPTVQPKIRSRSGDHSMPDATRRNFLHQTSIAGTALLLPVLAAAQGQPDKKKEADKQKADEGISPAEDLMREHGVLNRILLIYDEHLRLLAAKRTFDGSVLASAADIVKHFVEEYHEKLEEDFLFPRFRKAGKHGKLVDTLQAQHKAGRETTAKIRELAGVATLKYVSSDSEKLADALREFLRMYRPHEAREEIGR